MRTLRFRSCANFLQAETKRITQKRAKHAEALRTNPGGEGIFVDGEMDSLALCDELGRNGNSLVMANYPVEVGVHLLDQIFYPGF